MIDDSSLQRWRCIARVVEFVENHSRNGWNEKDTLTFHDMLARYTILLEEECGITNCVITLHSLTHLKEDIRNFAGTDNYSCWNKERAVRRYIKQSNNCKNIECTFAAAEIRREVIKFHKEPRNILLDPAKVDMIKVSHMGVQHSLTAI